MGYWNFTRNPFYSGAIDKLIVDILESVFNKKSDNTSQRATAHAT